MPKDEITKIVKDLIAKATVLKEGSVMIRDYELIASDSSIKTMTLYYQHRIICKVVKGFSSWRAGVITGKGRDVAIAINAMLETFSIPERVSYLYGELWRKAA
jgi:hypothetical protein